MTTQGKEVLFLPSRAARWKSLESLWKAVMEDAGYDAVVMPVPYYYWGGDGHLDRTEHYDGADLPGYVDIIDWHGYDFAVHRPYIIFINEPYDLCNYTSVIHPRFFSDKLVPYAHKLIYVPWFVTEEIDYGDPNQEKSVYNMRYYVTTPGVVNADMTIVQSERMRETYIKVLTAFAGDQTRAVWEDKIRGFGSPLKEQSATGRYEDIRASGIWELIKDALHGEEGGL